MMNKKTRIINVRVDAPNPHGRLKPGMFVRALVKAELSAEGNVVMDSSLVGKWVCPMHPDVIKDKPGKCPVCGMNLVNPKALGYTSPDSKDSKPPLVIPVTAPLITGKRAIVYIQTAPGTFEGKEVVLGPRGDGFYIVKSGLKEGELVVTNGNFKIDSSLQIMAKPSMMTAPSADEKSANTAKFQVPGKFKKHLDMIYNSYFKVQKALAIDNFNDAVAGMKNLKMMLKHINAKLLEDKTQAQWKKIKDNILLQDKQQSLNNSIDLLQNLCALVVIFLSFRPKGPMLRGDCTSFKDNLIS